MIDLVDTRIIGQFYQANTHLITFDPLVLPREQFCSWVKPPEEDDTEYYISYDEGGFPLDDLSGLNVDSAVAERGEILSNNIELTQVETTRSATKCWRMWQSCRLLHGI